MAKMKKKAVVRLAGEISIFVWADDIGGIESIEGVSEVSVSRRLPVYVFVDPRYDAKDVLREIEELLLAEVPAVFYEESE